MFGISRATEDDGRGGMSPAGDAIIIECENLTPTLDVNVSGTKENIYGVVRDVAHNIILSSPAERGAGSCVYLSLPICPAQTGPARSTK